MLALPEEIVIKILKLLPLKHLLRCTQVCSRFRDIVRDSVELQYSIELAADGLVDGVGCSLSTAERLQRLLELRTRWRHLDWTQVTQISSPAKIYAHDMAQGVVATYSLLDHLSVTWLPTSATPQPRTVERGDIGIYVRHLAIDPSQDLIAFLAWDLQQKRLSIHLRRISDNMRHPHASQDELTATAPCELRNPHIQIADDVIGLFVWASSPRLIIWNWRTGANLADWVDDIFSDDVAHFSFITSRAFMLIYTSHGDHHGGAINVYTLEQTSGAPTHSAPLVQPLLVAILRLPRVKPPHRLLGAYIHSSMLAVYPIPGRPFVAGQDTRIHVLELNYSSMKQLHLLFHNRYLVSLLPTGRGPWARDNIDTVELEWHQWGPDHTRAVSAPYIFHAAWSVYGSRAVSVSQVFHNGQGTVSIAIRDFNVHPKRHNDPTSAIPMPDDRVYTIVQTPERIVLEDLFEDTVETSLPYAMTVRSAIQVAGYRRFQPDQEVMLGMNFQGYGEEHRDSDVFGF